jgi:hypothetical protein
MACGGWPNFESGWRAVDDMAYGSHRGWPTNFAWQSPNFGDEGGLGTARNRLILDGESVGFYIDL